MRKSCFWMLTVVVSLGLSATANTVTWKTDGRVDDWNWNERGNFAEGSVPGAGDEVVIPAGLTVYVRPTDADSRSIVSVLGRIRPTAADSRLVVETAGENDVYEFGAMMNSTDSDSIDSTYRNGELVKRGEGEIALKNATRRTAYFTRITIERGSLRMPYTPNLQSRMYYGHVTVDEGAKLIIGTANTQGYNYSQPIGLWGKGLVTNECSHAQEMRPQAALGTDSTCVFEGVIAGNMRFVPYSRVMLTGTNSTCSQRMGVIGGSTTEARGTGGTGGILGVMRFGTKADPVSSLGRSATFGFDENCGAYLYLGQGEWTDKEMFAAYPRGGTCWMDGGAHGGLELAGPFNLAVGAMSNTMASLALDGSNAVPCVLSGPLFPGNGSDYFISKRGSGAWRLLCSPVLADRKNAAAYAIEEGTLQFDSLRPAGEICAFGLGTNRISRYFGARDDAAHRVDYNFLLGGTNLSGIVTEGVLEAVGGRHGGITNSLYAVDRPIALKGDGRLVMNALDNGLGVERRLTIRGVKSVADGLHTLTLDGTGTNDNMVADIEDGKVGRVSVVKEGTGTWVLAGTNSFSGGLTVRAGRLIVNNAKTYTWYRLVVKRLNGGGQLQVGELSLFDEAGANQVKGLKVESRCDASILHRGHLADGRGSIATWGWQTYFKFLFDGTTEMFRFKMYGNSDSNTLRVGDRSNGSPSAANPASWYYVDFRLPAGANPVASYDMIAPLDNIDPDVKQGGSGDNMFRNSIRGWALCGSVDGIHWDALHEIADAYDTTKDMHYAEAGKTNYWMAAQVKFDRTETSHLGGVAIASGISDAFPMLENSTVMVEPGAELVVDGDPLTIGKFRIGPNGGGTIRNVKFAERGEFAVDGLDLSSGSVTLHGTYEDAVGFANLEKWTLTEGGVANRRYVLTVNGNDVTVSKKGLLILVR